MPTVAVKKGIDRGETLPFALDEARFHPVSGFMT